MVKITLTEATYIKDLVSSGYPIRFTARITAPKSIAAKITFIASTFPRMFFRLFLSLATSRVKNMSTPKSPTGVNKATNDKAKAYFP